MSNRYSDFTKIVFISIVLFLFLDSTIGKYIYKKYIRVQLQDININFSKLDEFYDHKYPKNFDALGGWGNLRYKLCTDNNGFRTACKKKDKNLKSFDLAFIGDSFTEGLGYEYEKTFVGIIDKELKHKKIANLAMSSYSTSIYYTKLNKLIKDGFKFDEVIVFVDISDLPDDILCYEVVKDKVKRKSTFNTCFKNFNEKKNKFFEFYNKNFKITKILVDRIKNLFVKKQSENTKTLNVFNNSRSEWTYNYNKNLYNDLEYEDAISVSVNHMNNLYDLLKQNSIELSLAVYPWPGTLKYDSENNKHVKIWKNFCKKRCKKFYNLMPVFFEENYLKAYKKYYINNDSHFNELGNQTLAEEFLDLYKK